MQIRIILKQFDNSCKSYDKLINYAFFLHSSYFVLHFALLNKKKKNVRMFMGSIPKL